MAIDLADGKTAFWFNGNWAWPNLEEAGAEKEDEYGFLPYFLNNDPEDFVNSRIQASPSKQVMIDGQMATEKEKAAAKEFLNWIVYSEIGQQMIVKSASLIPPFQNNSYEPKDPLSRDIYEKVHEGKPLMLLLLCQMTIGQCLEQLCRNIWLEEAAGRK